MNRRRFLQYTIALAGAAATAKLSVHAAAAPSLSPLAAQTEPAGWIPTQAEVDEWLQYYKLSVFQGSKTFAMAVDRASAANGFAASSVAADPMEYVALYREAEAAFAQLEHDRSMVGFAQGMGYQSGREGRERRNVLYTGPSNEGFAWYNGWNIGNNDQRRRVTPA